MNRQIMCDRCGNDFTVEKSLCSTVEDDAIQVQYFSCPNCGAKYQILITDSRMRELIEKRQDVQKRIRRAQGKGFRERTMQAYIKERDLIIREQEKLLPELKRKGEEILHREAVQE